MAILSDQEEEDQKKPTPSATSSPSSVAKHFSAVLNPSNPLGFLEAALVLGEGMGHFQERLFSQGCERGGASSQGQSGGGGKEEKREGRRECQGRKEEKPKEDVKEAAAAAGEKISEVKQERKDDDNKGRRDMDDQGRRQVGYRFTPTQQELIYLLLAKVRRLNVSTLADPILEKNLYGKDDMEPWKVFCDVDNDKWELYDVGGKNDTKKVIYVFTRLSKVSARRIGRTAGCGKWDGQAKQDVKDYQGDKIIGVMKPLRYVVDPVYESEVANKGYWYMHEYSLSEHSLNKIGLEGTDYVICRIIRDDSKSCSIKPKGKNVRTNHSLNKIGLEGTDYVICRIIRDDSKSCSIKPKGKNVRTNREEAGFGDDVENNLENHAGEEINTGHYYDATAVALSVTDWSAHNGEMAGFGAQNNVQATNNEILSYHQSAGVNPDSYNPTIYTAPTEDPKCGDLQVVGSEKCSRVKDESVIVIHDVEEKNATGR